MNFLLYFCKEKVYLVNDIINQCNKLFELKNYLIIEIKHEIFQLILLQKLGRIDWISIIETFLNKC